MKIFLLISGVLLLLPGACGLYFTGVAFDENAKEILLISVPSIALGLLGIFLILYARRRYP